MAIRQRVLPEFVDLEAIEGYRENRYLLNQELHAGRTRGLTEHKNSVEAS
jgi:hypothetical protein